MKTKATFDEQDQTYKKRKLFNLPDINFGQDPEDIDFNLENFINLVLIDKKTEYQFWYWLGETYFSPQQERLLLDICEELLEKENNPQKIVKIRSCLTGILLLSEHESIKNTKKGLQYLETISQEAIGFSIQAVYLSKLGGLDNIEKSHGYYSKAVEKGCLMANYNWGMKCYDGEYVDKDVEKSREYFEKDPENLFSLYMLGKYYYDIDNEQKAFTYLKQAAELGHTDALYYLGRCYEEGVGVTENKTTALACFEKAALKKHRHSMYSAGKCCIELNDYEKSFEYFEMILKQDSLDFPALFQRGMLYHNKNFINSNYKKGIADIDASAKGGHAPALTYMGTTYMRRKNFTKAREYLEKIPGHAPIAWNYLGYIHEFGDKDTPIDMMKALKYYRKAKSDIARYKNLLKLMGNERHDRLYINHFTQEPYPLILAIFLGRFTLQSLNPTLKFPTHPAFVSFADNLKVAMNLDEKKYFQYSYKETSQIWDRFCNGQAESYNKDSEAFLIWSLMKNNPTPLFFKPLFDRFPDLRPEDVESQELLERDNFEDSSGFSNGLLRNKCQSKMIEAIESKFFRNRAMSFFHVMREKLPKEITHRILEDLQDTHKMPL